MSNQTDTQPASAPLLTLTAAFEGIEGSYSHAVLDAYAGRRGVSFAPLGCATYRSVVHAVLSGRADIGLLPVDNAIAGTIREGYDVLAEYELDPLAEITWHMEHRLLGVPGATLAGIKMIDSHPVVLAECGRFLATLRDVRAVPVTDTGIAARDVAAAGDHSRAYRGGDTHSLVTRRVRSTHGAHRAAARIRGSAGAEAEATDRKLHRRSRVGQHPQQLFRATSAIDQGTPTRPVAAHLALHHLRPGDDEMLGQARAHLLGDVAHTFELDQTSSTLPTQIAQGFSDAA